MKLKDNETLSIADAVSDVLEGKKPVQEMDPKKHVKKDSDSGMFCVYNTAGKKVKEFESKEEAEKYAIDNHDDLMKEADEPKAKGEKDFKGKHTIKKSGEKEDGSVVKEEITISLDEAKLKAGKGKAKIDVDHTGDGIPAASKKYKLKFKKTGDYYYDITGQKKDILAYLQSKEYGMDPEDIEEFFPELMEGLENIVVKKGKFTRKVDAATAKKMKRQGWKIQEEDEEDEEEIKEGFSKAQIKKAVEMALKMGGNMTGAVKKIEKMKKGLSKDKEVAAALQMANEEVTEELVAEAHAMNEAKSKMQEDKERYQKFFKAALKKFGVTSPGELEGEKKKEFFDYVDKNYEADNESD